MRSGTKSLTIDTSLAMRQTVFRYCVIQRSLGKRGPAGLPAYRPLCTRCYNRRMKTDDLYDFVLIGAGVLILCVLFAHGPFIHKPRHPMLFGILSATFIMTIYFLAHLV
jgi:hypothetical protein